MSNDIATIDRTVMETSTPLDSNPGEALREAAQAGDHGAVLAYADWLRENVHSDEPWDPSQNCLPSGEAAGYCVEAAANELQICVQKARYNAKLLGKLPQVTHFRGGSVTENVIRQFLSSIGVHFNRLRFHHPAWVIDLPTDHENEAETRKLLLTALRARFLKSKFRIKFDNPIITLSGLSGRCRMGIR